MSDELDQWQTQPKLRSNYYAIAVRRRWTVLVPFLCFGLAGYVATRLREDVYRSSAMILVDQQRIPDRYITPNMIVNLQQRLDSMTQQILSRRRLQALIQDLGLYERERQRWSMDDVIDRMRQAIQVEVVEAPGRAGELTGFKISYATSDPLLAQLVTNELVSLFLEENVRLRTQQSSGTTAFLATQLEQARKSLANEEARLREYKAQYTGELPEQQQANLQVLASLEAQLFANTASLERAEQQKVYLESLRAQYAAMQKTAGNEGEEVAVEPPSEAQGGSDTVLRDLQKRVAELRGQYGPRHPDLLNAQQMLDEWQALQKQAEADKGSGGAATRQASRSVKSPPPKTVADTALIEVEGRLKSVQVEIDSLSADAQKLRTRIQECQGHINLAPLRQQQFAEVIRSHENALANYQSLLKKKQDSELASNLEAQQQGDRLRLLEPANLPRKPESRLPLTGLGWAFGLVVGAGLALTLERCDDSFRDLKSVAAEINVPIAVRVPMIRGPRELVWHRWRTGLEVVAISAALAACISTNVQVLLQN